MRTLGVLSLMTALVVGLHYGGMVDFEPAASRIAQIAEKAELIERAPRHILVGLDITSGREREIDKDRQVIGEMVRDLRSGERMSVYLIHSRAESEQEAVFSVMMPEHEGPAGQVLLREKKAAEKHWIECWDRNVVPLTRSAKAQRTDLFGFMRFVSTQKSEFVRHPCPVLILFTDGQQVGDGYNMERRPPSQADMERAEKCDMVPNLRDVRLQFVGVTPTHGIDNGHWRKIQAFWKEYGRTAGVKSVSVSSERTISIR